MKKTIAGGLSRRIVLTIGVSISGLAASLPAFAQQELNALVWCDHTDPALIEPFEKANNVKVNLKEYEGTGAGLSIIEQSRPGDWDVFVVDGADIPRIIDMDLLAELPADRLPLADISPQVRMERHTTRDGKLYAVAEKFGYNAVSYDKSKVDPADMDDLSVLWSDKYRGRIAIYDYYLPIIGLTGLSLGKKTADLTTDDLPAIREKLFALKKAARQVSDVVASQTALVSGEVDIILGGGEWITASLAGEKPNLDWTVPKQGALRWEQTIGVFRDSRRQALALKFVQYILSPEAQAKLATASCYWGMPANRLAGDHLTAQQKTVLRWDKQPEYLRNTQLYPSVDADLDAEMQDVWTEMLQH